MDAQRIRDLKREEVECDLTFAGFVIFSCPMKPDSKSVIKELIQASHKVVMITGDNPLTACHVAKELRFTRKKLLVLTQQESEKWHWVSIDGETSFDISHNLNEILADYDFCITGEGLQFLREEAHSYMLQTLPYIIVCARFAPKQKEYVITTLKHLGYCTLMCGDGTNDVGALKHANVGVSLLSNAPTSRKKKKDAITDVTATDGIAAAATNSGNAVATRGSRTVATAGHNPQERQNLTPRERAILRHRENLNATQASLQNALKEMEEDQVSVVKLGDASIAAPFTSKSSSIICGMKKIVSTF